MTDSIHIATIPAGASIERMDDGKLMAFLPDGSAQMIEVIFDANAPNRYGISSIVTTFAPINLKAT